MSNIYSRWQGINALYPDTLHLFRNESSGFLETFGSDAETLSSITGASITTMQQSGETVSMADFPASQSQYLEKLISAGCRVSINHAERELPMIPSELKTLLPDDGREIPVMFRYCPKHDCRIAVFPTVPDEFNSVQCLAFQQGFQSGETVSSFLYSSEMKNTKPLDQSSPFYSELMNRLETAGYKIRVVNRSSKKMEAERATEAERRKQSHIRIDGTIPDFLQGYNISISGNSLCCADCGESISGDISNTIYTSEDAAEWAITNYLSRHKCKPAEPQPETAAPESQQESGSPEYYITVQRFKFASGWKAELSDELCITGKPETGDYSWSMDIPDAWTTDDLWEATDSLSDLMERLECEPGTIFCIYKQGEEFPEVCKVKKPDPADYLSEILRKFDAGKRESWECLVYAVDTVANIPEWCDEWHECLENVCADELDSGQWSIDGRAGEFIADIADRWTEDSFDYPDYREFMFETAAKNNTDWTGYHLSAVSGDEHSEYRAFGTASGIPWVYCEESDINRAAESGEMFAVDDGRNCYAAICLAGKWKNAPLCVPVQRVTATDVQYDYLIGMVDGMPFCGMPGELEVATDPQWETPLDEYGNTWRLSDGEWIKDNSLIPTC